MFGPSIEERHRREDLAAEAALRDEIEREREEAAAGHLTADEERMTSMRPARHGARRGGAPARGEGGRTRSWALGADDLRAQLRHLSSLRGDAAIYRAVFEPS